MSNNQPERALPDYAREIHEAEKHEVRTGRAFLPATDQERWKEEYNNGRD